VRAPNQKDFLIFVICEKEKNQRKENYLSQSRSRKRNQENELSRLIDVLDFAQQSSKRTSNRTISHLKVQSRTMRAVYFKFVVTTAQASEVRSSKYRT